MFAADFGVGQVVWSLFYVFLLVTWLILFINVVTDLIRSDDLSGIAKMVWIIALIVLPYLGVLVYFVARGGGMQDRAVERAAQHEQAVRGYIQQVAAPPSAAEELLRLDDLRTRGVINEAEFESLKAAVVAAPVYS